MKLLFARAHKVFPGLFQIRVQENNSLLHELPAECHSPFRLLEGIHSPIWDNVEQLSRVLKDGVIRLQNHLVFRDGGKGC